MVPVGCPNDCGVESVPLNPGIVQPRQGVMHNQRGSGGKPTTGSRPTLTT
ncbi:MAG: hypothetical protein AVDCRST_MAG57-2473 [uncultured Blastococcus sp.]|uniref:Uncharacterized protein n=1 Tax=uncultured Blastococcus sp. TaxID=217144 RepID=A0A6J4INK4_9ACTN|nr:MAG: hypothetical protein AVDCRST_MAG57-2473 [uncultured Blastococcus sp.]